jgi:TPR repeat protein
MPSLMEFLITSEESGNLDALITPELFIDSISRNGAFNIQKESSILVYKGQTLSYRVTEKYIKSLKVLKVEFYLEINNTSEVHNLFSFWNTLTQSIKNEIYPDKKINITCLHNGISKIIATQAYEIIFKLENKMRQLISYILINNIGIDWQNKQWVKEFHERNRTNKDKTEGGTILYDLDFKYLIKLIFDKYPEKEIHDLEENLDKLDCSSEDILRQTLSKYIPISIWDKYIANLIDNDNFNLEKKWSELTKLRNRVAHTDLITDRQYHKIKKIANEIIEEIDFVIQKSDEISLSFQDREYFTHRLNAFTYDDLLKSHENGDLNATFELANSFLLGYEINKDFHKAIELYFHCAEHSHLKAQEKLFNLYEESMSEDNTDIIFSENDKDKLFNIYSNSDTSSSKFFLAKIHDYKGEYKDAEDLLLESANLGYKPAKEELVCLYEYGRELREFDKKDITDGKAQVHSYIDIDIHKSIAWVRNLAKEGDAKYQIKLADWLVKEQNYEEAISWYSEAANQGNSSASLILGQIYEPDSQWIPSSKELSVKWYKLAVSQGSVEAAFLLGELLFGDEEYNSALSYYSVAAQKGHLQSQYEAGLAYKDGRGTSVDFEQSIFWFHKSAAQGDADSHWQIALLYSLNDGYSFYDLGKACDHLLKAIHLGLNNEEINTKLAELNCKPDSMT